MKAMILPGLSSFTENDTPLQMVELPVPVPGKREIVVRVTACGVCHTELDEIEGRTPPPKFPVVLGHQVVGQVEATGVDVSSFVIGDRVGIGWIYSACGTCKYCLSDRENLCQQFKATGRDVNGGYAQYMTVPEDFAYPIPQSFSYAEAAPLLCAGAIGYRSMMLTGLVDGQNLGLTGFGASGHLVLKMVRFRYPNTKIFVFARSAEERAFSLELGAVWAGDTAEKSPEKIYSIIDTTPVWKPVVEAMKNLEPGGRLVINAIRKEEIDKEYLLRLDYSRHLWLEKEIKSVANVTRRDVREFLELAEHMGIKPEIQKFELQDANRALSELKDRKIRGAKVLIID
jgi:propanol-preferring alcohol dehydrogenase